MPKFRVVKPTFTLALTEEDKQILQQMRALMNDPPVHSVVITITPAVASHIISEWRGSHNRHEKPAAIKRYAEAMAKPDGWKLNGSTVVFTDDHLLGDGQNRMLACIRSGRSFTTHVIFGVPQSYFATIDQGRVRSPVDVLTIAGVEHGNYVGPAVRWAELLEIGGAKLRHRHTFTPEQTLDLFSKHKAVGDWLDEARAIARQNRQPIPMVMALLYSFDKVDPDFAADFAAAWERTTYEPRFLPISKMQKAISKIADVSTGRIHEVVRAAMIIKAWQFCRAGRAGTGKSIQWDWSEPFPKVTDTVTKNPIS